MFILKLYLSLHELTCLLGLHNLHYDPYQLFIICSAILNNATCIVSHDIFPMAPLNRPWNRLRMDIPRVGHTRLDTDSPFCHLCITAVYEANWLANTKKTLPHKAFLTKYFTYRKEATVALKRCKAI